VGYGVEGRWMADIGMGMNLVLVYVFVSGGD
jgi:hypothetical protein